MHYSQGAANIEKCAIVIAGCPRFCIFSNSFMDTEARKYLNKEILPSTWQQPITLF
ncbi:hypothetical protein [Chroococcidiopsis sp. TS-821]|uniref:hypothetical protein n=1 Tax=Chroococcidiopsis sp. TS-821 TaxID=1378066 RepID=UPI00143D7C50|nr:hypothetical protein [Chroococcidiopsis sp. TS-821]